MVSKVTFSRFSSRRGLVAAVAVASAVLLAGCQDEGLRHGRAWQPIPSRTIALMESKGMTKYSPIMFRTLKKEAELEIWKQKSDGRYALLKTYPMCRWSGQLGPKKREGDRQVPEGFYTITPKSLNPNSAYYLSMNVGYPNKFDRAHGRTGSLIMVHGACSSRGCFSMTDKQIAEIYAIVREAFNGGQKAIQVQSLPFRMTPKNLAKYRFDKNMPFWKQLKKGVDHFEVTKVPPRVDVCGRRYVFNADPASPGTSLHPRRACPALKTDDMVASAVSQKHHEDMKKVALHIKKGQRAVRTIYADGGQHPSFAHVTMVSRPHALAKGPIEIALDDKGRPIKDKPKAARTRLAEKEQKKGNAATQVAAKAGKDVGKVTRVARTESGKPAAVTAYAPDDKPASKKPFYSRWLARISGGDEKPKAGNDGKLEKLIPGADVPAAKAKPISQKRGKGSNKRDKRAALPDIIRGAQPVLPRGLTAYAPTR